MQNAHVCAKERGSVLLGKLFFNKLIDWKPNAEINFHFSLDKITCHEDVINAKEKYVASSWLAQELSHETNNYSHVKHQLVSLLTSISWKILLLVNLSHTEVSGRGLEDRRERDSGRKEER